MFETGSVRLVETQLYFFYALEAPCQGTSIEYLQHVFMEIRKIFS